MKPNRLPSPLKLNLNLILVLSLLFTACTDENDRIADCNPGWHPCENDPSECCLDTTSHDFVWEIDTLGNYGSFLNDVAIVDEDSIWVVGNIETDSGEYNAARWNGVQWELLGIYSNTLDLYSIWYFAEDDIWVTSHCFPYHWDGETWTRYHLNNMGFEGACAGNAIWGSSPEDIWFVGDNGSIVHYDGTGFEKMESGTEVPLLDVWGTSATDIWVAGKDYMESVILHYNGIVWDNFYERDNGIDPYTLPKQELLLSIASIWKNPESDTLIAVGSWGIFHASTQNKGLARWGYPRRWDLPVGYVMGYPLRVRGRNNNDVFVVGQRSSILHFNGKTWHYYLEFYEIPGIWFTSLAFTEDIVYIVGKNKIMKAIKTY